jgi:hypothetical protein
MSYSGQIYEESAKAIWRDTNVSDLRDLEVQLGVTPNLKEAVVQNAAADSGKVNSRLNDTAVWTLF